MRCFSPILDLPLTVLLFYFLWCVLNSAHEHNNNDDQHPRIDPFRSTKTPYTLIKYHAGQSLDTSRCAPFLHFGHTQVSTGPNSRGQVGVATNLQKVLNSQVLGLQECFVWYQIT
ncbi:hypothetical protein ACA910_014517 [Epithemia clementina (nom. ined.)]